MYLGSVHYNLSTSHIVLQISLKWRTPIHKSAFLKHLLLYSSWRYVVDFLSRFIWDVKFFSESGFTETIIEQRFVFYSTMIHLIVKCTGNEKDEYLEKITWGMCCGSRGLGKYWKLRSKIFHSEAFNIDLKGSIFRCMH